MKKQYQISRLINNNVVFSTDKKGNEIIIFGKAIGFGKKRGDFVEDTRIIKIFEACDGDQKRYLMNLVEDIQPVYISLAAEIVSLFERKLDTKVNGMMTVSLSDHISNAVAGKREGFELPLDILPEIKNIYAKEFLIAKEGLKMIEKETGEMLSEDEAGYIVLHYINSAGKNYRSDAKFRLLFQEKIICEIEKSLQITLERSSFYYMRFLTHLSFLAARIHDHEMLSGEKSSLYRLFISEYPELKDCVERNAETIRKEFSVQISEDEKAYLAIHINNMMKSIRKKGTQQDESKV